MTTPTPNTQTAPEGYVMNAKGHYVPLSTVKEIDKLRDDVVRDIIGATEILLVFDFKAFCRESIEW